MAEGHKATIVSRYRAWRSLAAQDRISGKRVSRWTALKHATGWRIFRLFEKPKLPVPDSGENDG